MVVVAGEHVALDRSRMASSTSAATCVRRADAAERRSCRSRCIHGITTLTPTGASTRRQLAAQAVGDPEHRVLRRGVRADAGDGGRPRPSTRCSRTQPGSPDARMRGHERVDAVDHAPEVDVDHAVPLATRGSSHELPPATMPALFVTHVAASPKCSTAASAAALHRVGIGHVDDRASAPSAPASRSRAACSAEARLVAVGHRARASRRRRTPRSVASPMPLAAPVTTALPDPSNWLQSRPS